MVRLRTYLCVANLYVLVDILQDVGLFVLSHPFGDYLFYGKYIALLAFGIVKLGRKRRAKSCN